MLNPFPDFLALSFFAPLLLRLAVGAMFLNAGLKKFRERTWVVAFFERMNLAPANRYALLLGAVECVAGVLLIIGLYTQIAALVTLCIAAVMLLAKRRHPADTPGSKGVFFLLIVISLSLLLTGAGALAIDVPL